MVGVWPDHSLCHITDQSSLLTLDYKLWLSSEFHWILNSQEDPRISWGKWNQEDGNSMACVGNHKWMNTGFGRLSKCIKKNQLPYTFNSCWKCNCGYLPIRRGRCSKGQGEAHCTALQALGRPPMTKRRHT